jgi:hypothetical protein
VDSKQLTREQIKRLASSTRRHVWYLEVLTGRMHQKHFPDTDPLKMAAENAREAMAHLEDIINKLG